MKTTNQRRRGIYLVITGAALWGISGAAAQYLFHEKAISPEWLVVVRLLVSGGLLLTFEFIRKRKKIFTIWKESSKDLVFFGLCGMLGVQYTFFAAIQSGNAATAAILQYLSPIIITVYLAICRCFFPSIIQITSIFLAMFGTFLLVTGGNPSHLSVSPTALFWGISSAFAAAFYTVQPKRMVGLYSSNLVIGWGMLIGGVFISFFYPPWNFTGQWDTAAFSGVIFVILFGTIIAFYCYLESIKYITPAETNTLASVEPLSAVCLSVWFLGVPFGMTETIGALCIFSTVFLLARQKE